MPDIQYLNIDNITNFSGYLCIEFTSLTTINCLNSLWSRLPQFNDKCHPIGSFRNSLIHKSTLKYSIKIIYHILKRKNAIISLHIRN